VQLGLGNLVAVANADAGSNATEQIPDAMQ
jgi:hypothetical protein